jgi:hypothetical protein
MLLVPPSVSRAERAREGQRAAQLAESTVGSIGDVVARAQPRDAGREERTAPCRLRRRPAEVPPEIVIVTYDRERAGSTEPALRERERSRRGAGATWRGVVG